MSEEEAEQIRDMLHDALVILSQQQMKMAWILEALRRAGIEVKPESMH